jgi:hypothetical protein
MITHGLLVFDNTPAGARLTQKRFAGLRLLDCQIRRLAGAGITHLHILVPATADLSLTALSLSLDVQLEFISWNVTAHTPHNQEDGFLLLHGAYIHHQSSLHAFVRTKRQNYDLITQNALPVNTLAEPSLVTGTLTLPLASPTSSGAFLCAPDLFTLASLSTSGMDLWAYLEQVVQNRHYGLLTTPLSWNYVSYHKAQHPFAQTTQDDPALQSASLETKP